MVARRQRTKCGAFVAPQSPKNFTRGRRKPEAIPGVPQAASDRPGLAVTLAAAMRRFGAATAAATEMWTAAAM
jgi:hypothetical protein